MNLDKYLHELIIFDGYIYSYPSEDETCLKYGIKILEGTIDILECKELMFTESTWNRLYQGGNYDINIELECVRYNSFPKDNKIQIINDIKHDLDELSHSMFGVSGLIFPTLTSMFLMRDDVNTDDVIFLNDNDRHINILSTLVVDYIINLKPKSYFELYKIISYVVFNYMGYYVDNPSVGKSKLYEFTKYIGISKMQVDYYIENVRKNVGGIKELSDTIPDKFKTKPGVLHTLGVAQFAKRLYFDC